jgi:glucose-1-phosphate thymidylyltransferase
MKALILAAGYATRLYPLTKEYPKPLLLVGKKPIIDYIVAKLESLPELDEIIVVTNTKFISKFKKWGASLKTKKTLTLVDDLTKSHSDRRGAIGDMSFVIEKKCLKDNLLVIGGDNLFDGNLRKFISFARINKTHPLIGAYDIGKSYKATNYGVLKLDRSNKVVDFQEKPKSPKSTLVAMCLYYFPKNKLSLIKDYTSIKHDKHDATGFYIDWLRRREPVYAFVFGGRWYDIGHHQFYHEAQEAFIN